MMMYHTCTLKTGILSAALSAGEMSIRVQGADGETYGVSKIAGRKLTVAKPNNTGSKCIRRIIPKMGFCGGKCR